MSLLVQTFFGSVFAYSIGLVLTWRLTLVMIAVQPLVIGSFYLRSVLMKSMAGKAQKAQMEGSQLASEAVINHRTIAAFSSEKRMLELFKATLRGPKEESVKHSWLSGLGLFCSQFFNTAFITLTYWYGGRLLTEGLITSERLFQAFLILLFTAYVIAEAGSMTNDISKGGNAIRTIFAILDRKSEIDPNNSLGTSNIKRKLNIQVELSNVFAYPTRPDQMIFNVLNLKIDAGKTVALVGPSGSGKYTIIGLVERFYDSLNGAVFIDLQEITSFNLRTLGSHIALVSQEQHCVLELSVKILPMVEDARESEIRKAAVLATAQEFIRYIAVKKIKTPTQPCSYE
jgi:ATP-binding cassette subfamily B (MDR/TAP) protein 1